MKQFTDRFIKVPIRLYDARQKELMGAACEFDSSEKLDPNEIAAYHVSFEERDGNNQFECTQIYMKSGYTFLVHMTPARFEKLLNDHYDKTTLQ